MAGFEVALPGRYWVATDNWQAEEGPAGKSKAYVNLSRGWALDTAGFKATLQADHARSHQRQISIVHQKSGHDQKDKRQ